MVTNQLKDKGYLLVSEAARLSGRTPVTIYRWIRDGHIKGVRQGNTWYVHERSLKEFCKPKAVETG